MSVLPPHLPGTASAGPAAGRRRTSPRAQLSALCYLLVGTLLAMLFLFPMLYILLRSFLPTSADVDGVGLASLQNLTLENYAVILEPSVGLTRYARNSAIIALGVALGVGVVATLAGYALSRIRFRYSSLVFVILLAPLVVPYQGLLTPLSIILGALGLLDSITGVVLVLITLQLPFSVFVMRNTFDGIPAELEEAAALDGAGTLPLLRRVMIPLALPGIVTIALFGFMAGWNDLLSSIVFLSSQEKYTLPIALTDITTSFQIPGVQIIDPGLLTATACVAIAPVVVIFLVLQRHYTKGLIGGAIK
ncbi:carbohydrate ABC transporter permease [Brachybacterium hainanense]|uniref:Carbohydrate ABC transporter permease n=1 Tax=Brachybacterium hainanense TaxID=1541174 RepID=A0ABV6R840_9MICO